MWRTWLENMFDTIHECCVVPRLLPTNRIHLSTLAWILIYGHLRAYGCFHCWLFFFAFAYFYLSFRGYKNVMANVSALLFVPFDALDWVQLFQLMLNDSWSNNGKLNGHAKRPKLSLDTSHGISKIQCEKPRIALTIKNPPHLWTKMSVRVRLILTLKTNLIFALLEISQNKVNKQREKSA